MTEKNIKNIFFFQQKNFFLFSYTQILFVWAVSNSWVSCISKYSSKNCWLERIWTNEIPNQRRWIFSSKAYKPIRPQSPDFLLGAAVTPTTLQPNMSARRFRWARCLCCRLIFICICCRRFWWRCCRRLWRGSRWGSWGRFLWRFWLRSVCRSIGRGFCGSWRRSCSSTHCCINVHRLKSSFLFLIQFYSSKQFIRLEIKKKKNNFSKLECGSSIIDWWFYKFNIVSSFV